MKETKLKTDDLTPVSFRFHPEIVEKLNYAVAVSGLKKVRIVSMALEDYFAGPMAERMKRQSDQLTQPAKPEVVEPTKKLVADALKRKKQYG